MKNSLPRLPLGLLLCFICLWVSHNGFAQRSIANQIRQLKAKATPKNYRPFLPSPSTARMAADTAFVEGATVYRFKMNQPAVAQLQAEQNSFIEMSLPISATQTIDLELIPFSIFGPNFKVKNSKDEVVAPQDLGVFYQGIVKGDNQSIASISVINGEISGIISQKTGNLNLGREGGTLNYILFNDKDLKQKSDFVCGVAEAPVKAMGQNVLRQAAVTSTTANVACGTVEVYIEADSALYVAQGSTIAGAVNYVSTIFSKVATLYANESLSVVISEIKVWNTTDPYAATSNTLTAFRTAVGTSFNGRLAHLMSARNLGGGVAYLDVLCEKSYAHGYSGNLNNSHPALPTYSWNVEVMTHELGHNFGSPHTQSCTWPGGAIDNCYTTEGGCAPGPAPTNGGTIMSYCHLTSTGINFSNGFGTLPGNLIRQRAQDCLGSAVTPTNLTVLELYNTMALVSWSHASGVYAVEYRPVGSSTWISAGTSGNKSRYLSPLTANTAYEWRVNANCSDFVTGTFTTNNTPSPGMYCTPSHSQGCTYDIYMTSVVLGGTTLSSNSSCSSGGFTFSPSPIKSLVQGQATNFTVQLSGYYNLAQLAIWVDLNKDSQFQSNEKLYTTTTGQQQAFTGNITIPTTATNGQTRMRIIVNFSSAPTNPCGSYTYGETEDYYVNITCPAPTAYNVTGGGSFCSTGTGVAVGLSGSQTGVSYQLKRDNVAVGAAVSGTGAALDFGVQTVAGVYTVNATPTGCSATAMSGSATVAVVSAPTLAFSSSVNPTACGGSNGSIVFSTTNVSNGTYSVSFTSTATLGPQNVTVASNSFTLTNLSVGTYNNFTLTANGCTATDVTARTISNPPAPTIVSGSVTNATLCGNSDGSIAFTTTNIPNGTYQLSFTGTGSPKSVVVNANAFSLTGLGSGAYSNFSLTVNNCTASDATSKTIGNSALPTLTAGTVTNLTACGGTTGSIAFTTTNVPDGIYQLSFTGSGSPKSITESGNGFVLSGLTAGSYSGFSITINGCTATDATARTISNPPAPTIVSGSVTNATLCGNSDGSIAFTTTNIPNGTYQLSFTGTGSPKSVVVNANAFSLTGLGSGAYSNFSLTVNNCTASDATSKTVGNSALPTLTAGTVTNPTTCGGTNGGIAFTTTNILNGTYQLSYTGAGSPKTVVISANAFSISGLSSGVYSNFSVIANGCTATDATTKSLTPPSGISLVAGSATPLSTCGGIDGSITFTTTGVSNGSYQLTYSGAGSPKTVIITNNTFTLSGLAFGVYSNFSLTVNGCIVADTASKSINNPPVPNLLAGTVTNLSLCGGANGSIAFTTTNIPNGTYSLGFTGTGSPKSVTVSNNLFTLSGLSQGAYSNFSINVSGCNAIDVSQKTVNNPPQPTLLAGNVTPLTTCGGTDGAIAFTTTNIPSGNYQISYTGAGSPKTVTITNNSFTLTNLPAGVYTNFSITVNNCTATESVSKTINSPNAIGMAVSTLIHPTTCNGTNGSIVFTTTNIPSGNYQLTFAGAGSPRTVPIANNSFTLSNLGAGVYKNFAISYNSCAAIDTTTRQLVDPTPPNAGSISGALTLCVGIPSTLISSGTNGGTWSSASPTIAAINPNSGVVTGNIAGSSVITYTVTANGCTANTTATVTVDEASVSGSLGGSSSVCAGSNSTVLSLTGNTGAIQKWQWSLSPDFNTATDVLNALTTITVSNLSQTTYYRAVVKNGICNAVNSSTATVTVNPLPTVGFSGPTSIVVGSTTTIFPTAGGTWISNNAVKASVTNAGIVTGLDAGTSTFTFTNSATGCKNSTSILIVTSTSPCNQSITMGSPTNDISSGSVVKQTNLGIDASNRVTGTNTSVTYQSGSSVTLKPGFQAEAGTVFKAQIGGCN